LSATGCGEGGQWFVGAQKLSEWTTAGLFSLPPRPSLSDTHAHTPARLTVEEIEVIIVESSRWRSGDEDELCGVPVSVSPSPPSPLSAITAHSNASMKSSLPNHPLDVWKVDCSLSSARAPTLEVDQENGESRTLAVAPIKAGGSSFFVGSHFLKKRCELGAQIVFRCHLSLKERRLQKIDLASIKPR